ncbi:MAG: serine kinase [Lentimicrobiaceae bacterium]|jgi:serine kinase of HPr protein (carbohydrate metabolism regulator)|nr:serine kinase [Lentimicrobiaceae bacterium]
MNVKNIVDTLGLQIFSGEQGLDREITGGYTSDLLSDVMGHADARQIWITLQTHKNIMAIASLKELAAIILVKGYTPEQDTATQSNAENIPILGTTDEAFAISGKLYKLLEDAKL